MPRYFIRDNAIIETKGVGREGYVRGSSMFGPIEIKADAGRALIEAKRRQDAKREAQRAAAKAAGMGMVECPSRPRVIGEQKYRMNRKEVRKRAIAYSLLSRSMRFLAFYSISFPLGIPDEVAYDIWNRVLTRLRQDAGLRSYLWVSERQQNGTTHYHMLTNDWMDVREVNRYTAVAIEHEVEAGRCTWGRSSLQRYNGVDVKAVVRQRGGMGQVNTLRVVHQVCSYLAKYMSKETHTSARRLWHCSRLVSALVTTAEVSEMDIKAIIEEQRIDINQCKVVTFEWCAITFVSTISSYEYRYYVSRINDEIDYFFQTHNLY